MVQNYQELQDALAKTSESIGALAADFDQQTDEMAQYVADMVQDMDLSAEAKQAAIQTPPLLKAAGILNNCEVQNTQEGFTHADISRG